MRRIFLAGLMLAMAVGGIGAAQAGKASDTLNIAFDADFQAIEPYRVATREGDILVEQVYDTLLYRDPVTFAYQPLLASGYHWIDDKTIEFALRHDVIFHDGSPFTAADVVFTFNHIIQPQAGTLLLGLVNWIKDAEEVDPYTVRVHLVRPYAAALDFFALPLRIYSKAYFDKVGPEGVMKAPMGTGPYRVVSVDPGRSAVLERFEKYFPDSPKSHASIKRITVRVMPEMNTQIAELLTGKLDWAWRVPPDQAQKLSRIASLHTASGETMRFSYIGFDAAGRAGKSPVQDRLVREAIAHAINRQAIRDNLVQGSSRVIDAACYPQQFGCTEDVPAYDYDPAKARALLAQAGYPNGFTIEMLSYGGAIRDQTEAVVGDLRAVGITVVPQFLQPPTTRQKILDGEAHMVHMHWGSDSVNDIIHSTGQFFDLSKYDMADDAGVAKDLLDAVTTLDIDKRKALDKAALTRIAEQVYWIPVTTFVTNYAFIKDLVFAPAVDEYPRFYLAHWQ